jgi:hypothetical protein
MRWSKRFRDWRKKRIVYKIDYYTLHEGGDWEKASDKATVTEYALESAVGCGQSHIFVVGRQRIGIDAVHSLRFVNEKGTYSRWDEINGWTTAKPEPIRR